jgi:hypothetical protein
MPGRRWRGGLGPRERMVPLNSWPMVMGRVSFVTGWGVVGEKLRERVVNGVEIVMFGRRLTWVRRSIRVGLRGIVSYRSILS